ncbi:GFA family protein [Pararhizobium sp. IMCC21322]|uniref:GFA family protein n=1 Tax=Pararhizobium sp. IMCC21322 TaxID=3067903 RepID=UPI002742428F|nr:GFA family protein [Pararhizobium sp. IMCC21322]
MERKLKGQCLCRTVTYEVADAFEYAMNCHCSDCRRSTGSAFKPMAGIGIDRIGIVSGQNQLLRFGGGDAHDLHCVTCGSLLYSVVRDGTFAHVTLGTLVDTPSIRPTAHIFVGSKAEWFEITDDLPQHREFD